MRGSHTLYNSFDTRITLTHDHEHVVEGPDLSVVLRDLDLVHALVLLADVAEQNLKLGGTVHNETRPGGGRVLEMKLLMYNDIQKKMLHSTRAKN